MIRTVGGSSTIFFKEVCKNPADKKCPHKSRWGGERDIKKNSTWIQMVGDLKKFSMKPIGEADK
jgi:hypothetical protein